MSLKILSFKTYDDCEVRLHKQAAHGSKLLPPVLLVHGIAATARMWQSPFQEGHLASFLSHFGYPVYSIDLRNRHGKPSRDWNLDDYVLFDLPAALAMIAEDAGYQGVHWVGHSMGGLLGYMYQALHGASKILSLTTLGSPGFHVPRNHGHSVRLAKNLLRMTSLGVNTGRLDLIPRKIMTQLVRLGFLSGRSHRVDSDRAIMEELQTKQILGNISFGEAKQITGIAQRGGICSPRFKFAYLDYARKIEAPLLAIAADRDYIVPVQLVKQGFLNAHTKHRYFIELVSTSGSSYGHLDLVMSRYARSDIWEEILKWITQWNPSRVVVPGVRSMASEAS